MNIKTGEILNEQQIQEFRKRFGLEKTSKTLVEIDESDLTERQKENKQVSLKDHTSILGNKLTNYRREKRIHKNDLCWCNSGKIFKYCCQSIKKSERSFNS